MTRSAKLALIALAVLGVAGGGLLRRSDIRWLEATASTPFGNARRPSALERRLDEESTARVALQQRVRELELDVNQEARILEEMTDPRGGLNAALGAAKTALQNDADERALEDGAAHPATPDERTAAAAPPRKTEILPPWAASSPPKVGALPPWAQAP